MIAPSFGMARTSSGTIRRIRGRDQQVRVQRCQVHSVLDRPGIAQELSRVIRGHMIDVLYAL